MNDMQHNGIKLSVDHLTKYYRNECGDIKILSDVSFTVKMGEFLSVIGPSGCGKTTLINIIAGLEKTTVGSVKCNGQQICTPGADRAIIFQEAALFPWLTVIKNVEFGLKMAGVPKKIRKEKALYYLNLVHLTNVKDYAIHQLSGGMKQRIAIARALALESDVLLMDEPFISLDAYMKATLHAELINLWMKTKKTIVFITHDIEEAVMLADRVIILSSKPACIINEYSIALKRPRKIGRNEQIIIDNVTRELQRCSEM